MNGPWRPTETHSNCILFAANLIACGLLLVLLLLAPGRTAAGGGPETTLLVVNAQSPLSLRIANEYVQLRDIPQTHVVWLHDVPITGSISIALFRERIWRPISEFISDNKLEHEIDAIVYSADFPYGVNFDADLKVAKRSKKNKYLGRRASLTALTYFAKRVSQQDTGYLGKNHYFRDFARPSKKLIETPASAPRLDEKQIKKLRREANGALRRGDYAKAISGYRQLLNSHPQSAQGWHDLARGLAAVGKDSEALAALANAVDRGWTNSLSTRNDTYLKALGASPGFGKLVERMEASFHPILLPHGFRHRYVWSNADLTYWEQDDFKDQYYLSTLLAYTGARGNSFPEVMRYLRTAKASDGSRPDGTVYLMENTNIRSKTRQHLFPTTLDELAKRGRRGRILSKHDPGQNGIIPVGKRDVIGLVVGSPKFDWDEAKSRLLPGAIAESLTSYGGDFNNGKQTKLSEFLRQGAAGSSGAVAEPYSFQEKFPVPLMHSFYAEGCSLAESFYQSVEYPYQLIVVGDPLARPFARFATIDMKSPDPTQPWSGIVEIRPSVTAHPDHEIETVELWINGQRLSSAPVGEQFTLDTRQLADGTHQLRLVAVEDSRIETRSYARFDIQVANSAKQIWVNDSEPTTTYGDDIEISGTASTDSKIMLFQGYRKLGSATPQNGKWKITVPSTQLGLGPVVLRVESRREDGVDFRSAPVALTITEAARQAASTNIRPLNRGLSGVIHDVDGTVHSTRIEQLKGTIRIAEKKKINIDRLSLSGFLNIDDAGFYQLVVKTSGRIKLSINDRTLLDKQTTVKSTETILPLSLAAGWHRLQIELDADRRRYLKIVLAGDRVAELLGGDKLGHQGKAP